MKGAAGARTNAAADATRLVVPPEHAGLRLDQLLAAATALSRRRARGLISAGEVVVDGRPVRVQSRPVELATVVDVRLPAAELGVPSVPELPPVEIAWEDADLLVAVKPPGVLSQPAERRRPGELAFDERVALALALREGARPFLRLLHRLDRVTSGLLLFARRPQALPPLTAALRGGRLDRWYLAVVEGEPTGPGSVVTVTAPLARDPSGAWRFVVAPAGRGRPAETRVEVIGRAAGRTLVCCRLVTGRTHQVRVHLAHLGTPVVADRLYGARDRDAPRALLHAWRLRLPHPHPDLSGNEPLTVTAPWPDDFPAGFEDALRHSSCSLLERDVESSSHTREEQT